MSNGFALTVICKITVCIFFLARKEDAQVHQALPSPTSPSRAAHLALLLLLTSLTPTTVSTTAVRASTRAINPAAATMTSSRGVSSVFEMALDFFLRLCKRV